MSLCVKLKHMVVDSLDYTGQSNMVRLFCVCGCVCGCGIELCLFFMFDLECTVYLLTELQKRSSFGNL